MTSLIPQPPIPGAVPQQPYPYPMQRPGPMAPQVNPQIPGVQPQNPLGMQPAPVSPNISTDISGVTNKAGPVQQPQQPGLQPMVNPVVYRDPMLPTSNPSITGQQPNRPPVTPDMQGLMDRVASFKKARPNTYEGPGFLQFAMTRMSAKEKPGLLYAPQPVGPLLDPQLIRPLPRVN